MNQVIETIRNRRSTRAYKPDAVPTELLETLLEAADLAPSGHNEQPWHFAVIRDRSLITEISEISKATMKQSGVDWMVKMGDNPKVDLTYGAPVLIVVSGRKDAVTWEADCAAAIQNLLLTAESVGLGTVWLGLTWGYLKSDAARTRLSIPEGYEPYYSVAVGYKADERPKAAPARKGGNVVWI